jgi:hypothetical protein
MCFVWISEQTAIISLYSINLSVLITEEQSVYCAVRTGSSNRAYSFVLKGLTCLIKCTYFYVTYFSILCQLIYTYLYIIGSTRSRHNSSYVVSVKFTFPPTVDWRKWILCTSRNFRISENGYCPSVNVGLVVEKGNRLCGKLATHIKVNHTGVQRSRNYRILAILWE